MPDKTLRILRWVVGGIFGLLGLVALILHFLTRQPGLGKAAVAALEAKHKPAIEAAQKRVDELKQDLAADAKDVAAAQAEVTKREAALKKVYSATGVSAKEAKERLARLRL